MRIRISFSQTHRRYIACRPILISIALGVGIVSMSEARASTFRVFTSSASSSMTLNANDGFCSLAEAVQHAAGNTIYNCMDFDPSSDEQRIELVESAGKPFSTNHFKITGPLTLSRQGVSIHIFGSAGFIDSTAPKSSFVIPFKSIAFFERVTLTNTAGSAGGRLLENYGELRLYGVTITKGDVTGSQNPSGRGGGIFNGNTQGLFPGLISSAENSLITGNKAKKGGGIYNDSGNINELAVTISNNTATLAGGGIYNISTTPLNQGWTNGSIVTIAATIQGNSARTGGGVFNRGLVQLGEGSSITGNSTTTTGSSGETCTGSASCDGVGGGVVSDTYRLPAPPHLARTRDSCSRTRPSRTTRRPRAAARSIASGFWNWQEAASTTTGHQPARHSTSPPPRTGCSNTATSTAIKTLGSPQSTQTWPTRATALSLAVLVE